MTRKKFIKQLMGRYGIERNKANTMANSINRRGGTYATGLLKYDLTVKAWAETFGIPYSMLLTREKGANKAYRRHLKSQKRAAHLFVYTHTNQPGPDSRVTVRVGRSSDQQETGGAAV